jgi:hypothetical protein
VGDWPAGRALASLAAAAAAVSVRQQLLVLPPGAAGRPLASLAVVGAQRQQMLLPLVVSVLGLTKVAHVSMSAAVVSGTRGTGQGPRSIADSATGAYATHSQTLQALVTLLEAQQRFDVQQRYN